MILPWQLRHGLLNPLLLWIATRVFASDSPETVIRGGKKFSTVALLTVNIRVVLVALSIFFLTSLP